MSLDRYYELAAQAVRRGDMFGLFDCAREGLATEPDDERLRYLQTLALARLGEPPAALALYERNRVGEIADEASIELKGRILKDMAVRASGSEQKSLFEEASRAYQAANTLNDSYLSAINVATTAFLAGDDSTAYDWASAVAARPEIAMPGDYATAVIAAESLLLRGQIDKASARLELACQLSGASLGERASTMRQLGLIADRLMLSEAGRDNLLKSIQPPPVLHYCGHMFAAGWDVEPDLAVAISAALDETGAMVAYGSLACGGDILVAEALLERGGEVNVILPFDEEDFIAASVAPGGSSWVSRFHAVRAQAASFSLSTQMPFIGDDNQFAYGSRLAMGLARLRSKVMQTKALQLALSDNLNPSGGAGTSIDLANWARQGGERRIIPVPPGRPRLPLPPAVIGYSGPKRGVYAILFADFSGFSKLTEPHLPEFLGAVMARISEILDRYGKAVLSRNTWGDAVHAVIDTPESAASIALDIQARLSPGHLQAAGLPDEGGMRISLHLGPIYEDFDPIRRERTYYGTEVTLAARIEPRVPVGAIYVTQPFAAMLDQTAAGGMSFEYVGTINLAKDYGTRVIYRLLKK